MLDIVKQFFKLYGEDRVGQLSAAFSYFTLFSIGPLLLILVSAAGFVFGDQAAEGELARQLSGTLGTDVAATVQQVVSNTSGDKTGVIGLVIGGITLLLGASGLFGQLHGSFDQIFRVKADPKAGWVNFVWPRLKGIILLGLVSVLVIASVIASTLVSSIGQQAEQYVGLSVGGLQFVNFLFSTLIIGLLLSLIYRTLPDIVLPPKIVLAVGLIIGLFFSFGKTVLGFIIAHNGAASAYGAAAALITLLLWVFYFGQIVFIGAEIIKMYGDRKGLVYPPKRMAVKQKSAAIYLSRHTTNYVESFQRGLMRALRKK